MNATAFNILVAVTSVMVAGAAFYGANRATRLKASTDNRAVDAAAYTRATDIYESTIATLRAEIGRLTDEVKAARAEIQQVHTDLGRLQDTNDELMTRLSRLRGQEHDDLTRYRKRDAVRLDDYDNGQGDGADEQGA